MSCISESIRCGNRVRLSLPPYVTALQTRPVASLNGRALIFRLAAATLFDIMWSSRSRRAHDRSVRGDAAQKHRRGVQELQAAVARRGGSDSATLQVSNAPDVAGRAHHDIAGHLAAGKNHLQRQSMLACACHPRDKRSPDASAR
jgi:hypothetical protein